VILPVGASFPLLPEAWDLGNLVSGVVSIVGFWSCSAKTREAAPFARLTSGAKQNI
jgi:hypothetical protein